MTYDIYKWTRFAVKRQHNSNTDFKIGLSERVDIDDSTWVGQDGLPAPMQRDLLSFNSFNPFGSFVSVESWLPVRDRSPSPGFSEAQVVRTRLSWASDSSTFEQREMLGLYLFEAFPQGIFKLSDVNAIERIFANQDDLQEVSTRDWDSGNHSSTFILNAGIVVERSEVVDITWYVIDVLITYRGKIGKVNLNPV